MKVFILCIMIAIAIFDILLVFAVGMLKTEADIQRDDEEQMKWLKERKDK